MGKTTRKQFDRSICFTLFSSQVDTIKAIAEQHGEELGYKAFVTLADYCLYNKLPDPSMNPWGFAWPLIKREADNSMNNRRRGFGTEDAEKTEAITAYMGEHPDATRREVARAVGCSVGKVQKVLAPSSDAGGVDDTGGVDGAVHGNGSVDTPVYSQGYALRDSPPETVNSTVEVFGQPLDDGKAVEND